MSIISYFSRPTALLIVMLSLRIIANVVSDRAESWNNVSTDHGRGKKKKKIRDQLVVVVSGNLEFKLLHDH